MNEIISHCKELRVKRFNNYNENFKIVEKTLFLNKDYSFSVRTEFFKDKNSICDYSTDRQYLNFKDAYKVFSKK